MRYKIAGEIWGYSTKVDEIKNQFSEYEYQKHADEVTKLCTDGVTDFRNYHSMSAAQAESLYQHNLAVQNNYMRFMNKTASHFVHECNIKEKTCHHVWI